ncbi:hypothetical protein GX865_02970 [Candidatus Saccharibacteria bacterium]|jgi:membrane protein YdbS with pleckstrin-like domain|nr:hypothetical protein [Candidatus Saccharibacteria bacterium]
MTFFDDHNPLDDRGRVRMRDYSVDDKDYTFEWAQGLLRKIIIVVVVVAAVLVFFLVYVFNKSPDRSSSIMTMVVAVVTVASVIVFVLRALREFLVDRHERASGEIAKRFGSTFDFNMTQDEFIDINESRDDQVE